MKKIIASVLAMFMAVSLVACEDNKSAGVKKEAFDVKITLPAELMEDVTQEDLDEGIEEGDFHSAAWNEDGSVTYTMSKSQHKQLMKELKEEMDDSLDDMVESEDFPNFTKIVANDAYTKFTITTHSAELDFMESFSEIAFYMYGAVYNIFDGNEDFIIEVEYINAESGEVIYATDSSTLEEEGSGQ